MKKTTHAKTRSLLAASNESASGDTNPTTGYKVVYTYTQQDVAILPAKSYGEAWEMSMFIPKNEKNLTGLELVDFKVESVEPVSRTPRNRPRK